MRTERQKKQNIESAARHREKLKSWVLYAYSDAQRAHVKSLLQTVPGKTYIERIIHLAEAYHAPKPITHTEDKK